MDENSSGKRKSMVIQCSCLGGSAADAASGIGLLLLGDSIVFRFTKCACRSFGRRDLVEWFLRKYYNAFWCWAAVISVQYLF